MAHNLSVPNGDRDDAPAVTVTRAWFDPRPCQRCGHLAEWKVTGYARERSGWLTPAVMLYCDDDLPDKWRHFTKLP